MGPLATRIGELVAEVYELERYVEELEGRQLQNRKRLTPGQVREIRRMWDDGFSAGDISAEFGINRATAHRIGKRQYHRGVI